MATPNPINPITASLPAKHAIDTNPQLPKVQDYTLQQLNKTATKFWKKRVPQLQLYAKDLKKITKTSSQDMMSVTLKREMKKTTRVG